MNKEIVGGDKRQDAPFWVRRRVLVFFWVYFDVLFYLWRIRGLMTNLDFIRM